MKKNKATTSTNKITPAMWIAYLVGISVMVSGWAGFNVLIMVFLVMYVLMIR